MSQLRLDPLTGRWVVVSTGRMSRPEAFLPPTLPVQADHSRPCPFCPGSEDIGPVLEAGADAGSWQVKVVPNRYPAFEGEEPMVVNHRGPLFTEAPASGLHEVLVLSPDHQAGWGRLSERQTRLVMAAIRDRVVAHSQRPGLRYTQVIVNAGREAGASLEHPHAQLLALPFVPRELADEQAGFARFAGGCLMCAAVQAEVDAHHRMVYLDDHVAIFCPFWSGVPFEMMVVPQEHLAHLSDSPQADLDAVGNALRIAISHLRNHVGEVAYNLVFHSAPYRANGQFHWHVHVLPKLTTLAGFELGTGVLINIVPPEEAAQALRSSLAAA